jgi:hypothetical protein
MNLVYTVRRIFDKSSRTKNGDTFEALRRQLFENGKTRSPFHGDSDWANAWKETAILASEILKEDDK